MDLRAIARWAGLLGGLAWLGRYVLDLAGFSTSMLSMAYWTGAVLLAIAIAAMGVNMVSANWLRLVVGIAFPLLVWSVLETLHPAGNAYFIDAAFGLLAVVIAAVAITKAPGGEGRQRPRRAGAHAR